MSDVAFAAAALQKCPPDAPVRVAYDSLVCVYDLELPQMFIVDQQNENMSCGVYLCAMNWSSVAWALGEGDQSDPSDHPFPARRVDPEKTGTLLAEEEAERQLARGRNKVADAMQAKAKEEGRWTGYYCDLPEYVEWQQKGAPLV